VLRRGTLISNRMELLKTFAQPVWSDPRIDQSGLNPNMPQQRSDDCQTRPVFVQVGCERPAKGVRRNIFQPGSPADVFNEMLKV
jgi:hypothetical protein